MSSAKAVSEKINWDSFSTEFQFDTITEMEKTDMVL